MPSQVTSPSPAGGGARWSWLVPAGTFVAGCVLGGVVVGVGEVGGGADDSSGRPVTAADAGTDGEGQGDAGAGDEPSSEEESGLYVRVPDSCVRTAEDATTLVGQVDRVVAAVADLEPERLRQTVDDVQQIRDEVQDVAAQCQEAAAQQLQQDAEPGAEPDGEPGAGADDDAPAS